MKTNKDVKNILVFGICISSIVIIALIILLIYTLCFAYKNIPEQDSNTTSEFVSNDFDLQSTTEYNILINNNNITSINSDNAIIYDIGFITNIGDMLWFDDNNLIIIGISEYNQTSYIWVLDNDINENTTTEKAIISLDTNEHYSSIRKLSDNKVAIATTKRIIFLNNNLFESRSVMISSSNTAIKEVSINNDGTAILYINDNGLYYQNLKSKKNKLLVDINIIGEGSMPYNVYFCDNNKVAFHYITSDLKLYCGISDINGDYTIFDKDSNYLSAITDKNVFFIDRDNRNKLIAIDTNTNNEIHYNFQNFIPLSLISQNNKIYICGLNNVDNVYSVNVLDNNRFNTEICVNDNNSTFGGFVAVSPRGRVAVQKYSQNTENTKILILG